MNHIGGSYCFSIGDIFRNMKNLDISYSKIKLKRIEVVRIIIEDFIYFLLQDIVNDGV
jgi:hypothetical protein